jgi:uncharacterized protein YdeI (YjbR/CyaY-like superfamily)
MPTNDKRVDAYIANSADFAKPILIHFRQLVHQACPQAEETLKWGVPHFTHKGVMCMMAAFKRHCHFGFWKGDLIFDGGEDSAKPGQRTREQLRRITCLAELPADEALSGFVKKAAALNEAGVKSPARKRAPGAKDLLVPEFLMAALRKNKKALAAFEALSYSHKKEYVQWVAEAKREETRKKRTATTVAWLADGKPRNWKHERS